MHQTVSHQHWFKIFLNLWNKIQVFTFDEKLTRTLKRQYGSNHIVPDTVFLRIFWTQELYVLSVKTDKIYLKGQYGTTQIAPDKTLAKVFVLSMKIDKIYLRGLYMGQPILSQTKL